ncbi:unnamed protein product [Blepharisma stoltei]|uniref:Uncharacterized protein n=1 Tax=Blepharisma stoltei TaxID=1481888 RepID=A0AAU9J350_9CILI|nr:unnamed protein product [Blepharisma stoltei]
MFFLLIAVVSASVNYPIPGYYGTWYKDFLPNDTSATAFYWSSGYHIGSDMNLWIADPKMHEIKMIKYTEFGPPRGKIYKIVGYTGMPGMRDGDVSSALLNSPSSLVYFSDTMNGTDVYRVYIADTYNNCIRELDLMTGTIWEFVGSCNEEGFKDGPYGTNRLYHPTLVGIDDDYSMFIWDSGNRYIRMVNLTTRYMETLRGGACRSTDYIDSEYQNMPDPSYDISYSIFMKMDLKIYEMICMKSMVLTSGEPSAELYDPNNITTPCFKQDILCGDRDHPLVGQTNI